MFDKIDTAIIERGFQPLVNRLMQHPVDIGINSSIGCSVMMVTGWIGLAMMWPSSLTYMVACSGIILQCVLFYINYVILRKLRPMFKPGLLSPMRPFYTTRMVLMIDMIIITPLDILAPSTPGLFFLLAVFGYNCGSYILACSLPPSKPVFSNPILNRTAQA